MKVAVIFCHPWESSFNRAELEAVASGLKKGGHIPDIIDLYREGFNPVMSKKDLSLYSEGGTGDDKVMEYHRRLNNAGHFIFITPVWWGTVPALMKGFIDKVFIRKWAFEKSPSGMLKGKLQNKGASLVTTSAAPSVFYRLFLGNPVKKDIGRLVLKTCGIRKLKHLHFGGIEKSTLKRRKKWLEYLESYAEAL